ncbi:hypothetical protein H5410_020941 [Solanum commersonii]|uniref:Photosystem I PsaA/PsaB n=1 Tax=Solanum commersonii TaxID=4109 RepID=A0A9J5ZDR0_SOLCO|nr:hypothetical protein H5410_020941 [Solanum commersonii]
MALRFPRFSQGLAHDPTTRHIWFGIATAHDFESHDDSIEERLYQNIFASHFGQLAIIFLGTRPFTCKTYCSCNLGSSFWSTGRGSFYSRGCSWPSEYRLFWCLSVVVYNRFTH